MVQLPGNFTAAFQKYRIRKNGSWETNPILSGKVTPSSYIEVGTYELEYPNPKGLLDTYISISDTQELWIAKPSTSTMYRTMTGVVNNVDKKDKHKLKIGGRDLTGLLMNRQVVEAWQNKTLDYIICDETYGIIQIYFPNQFTTFNAFSLDYDDFIDWQTDRWGSAASYASIDAGIYKITGDAAATRTINAIATYNYQFITFRARVTANANHVYFGLTDGTNYIRFDLPVSGTIACQNSDGTPQTSNVSGSYTPTNYNYYRIEWSASQIRFFVNGVLEVTQTLNVPAGALSPYFQLANAATQLWVDYIKVVRSNKVQERYKIQSKSAYDSLEDLCQIAGTNDIYVFWIDNQYDLHAQERVTVPSGQQLGYGSSTYTNNILAINFTLKGDEIKNTVYVYGGERLTTVSSPNWTDQFTGNGVETSYALGAKAKKPLTLVQVNGGTLTEDTDFTVNYGTEHTTIKFTTAPGNGHTINLRYDYFSRVFGFADDDASVTAYGIKDLNYNDDNIESIVVANDVAQGLLTLHSNPRISGTITVPMDPTVSIGQTVMVDAPYYGITTSEYEVMKVEHELPAMKTTLQLISTEITTMPEVIKAIFKELKDIRASQVNPDLPSLKSYQIEETISASAENANMTWARTWVCDSFILDHTRNGLLDQGVILMEFESGIGGWTSTDFTLGISTSIYRVGAQSMSLVYGGTGALVATSTDNYGNLSAYTGANSGAPIRGCVGLWVYLASATQISSVVLRIGSDSSNYAEQTGTICDTDTGNAQRTGWNYFVFPLATASITGTPVWTATDYTRLSITTVSGSVFYADYLTISRQNDVGLNGYGRRDMSETAAGV